MPDTFPAHHRGILEQIERFRSHSVAFALCVVLRCSGSTYRKAGALAVVGAGGERHGVISGGCLESDLEFAAAAALAAQRPRLAHFDTRSHDDLVFGSGSGCRGAMQVLMLPVAASTTHPLCEALLAADRAHEALSAAIIASGPNLGGGLVWSASLEAELPPRVESLGALRERPPGQYQLDDGSDCCIVSFSPSPRMLVIGAGPEAPALIAIASELGWRVTVADHREALLERQAAGAERTLCARPAAALRALGDQRVDACIVMTHTAANDREALAALARRTEPFIGLLGPAARRDELLAELDPGTRGALTGRLHAPVGLRLGGHGPEALALSICAELHSFLAAANDPRT
jgi:xanthine dehydrogenase accessory factor